MKICEYGCNQKATYKFKNGKWCCEINVSKCPNIKQKNITYQLNRDEITDETRNKLKLASTGRKLSEKVRQKISKLKKGKRRPKHVIEKIKKSKRGSVLSDDHKKKISITLRPTIKEIKRKYPLFSKIEEIRYNPNKPNEKEIQVHCKNHTCKNSKERGGWFTPKNRDQFYSRIYTLEKGGYGERYFYCSDQCKDACPLYNKKLTQLLKEHNKEIKYTNKEYQQFRKHVLNRDKYVCQYCERQATYVHHERPQKLEPFFALDPDYAWSVCKKCHYEKGHKDECSTGSLANKVCREEVL